MKKTQYINRHKKLESKYWDTNDMTNLTTSSFWALHLLWSDKDIFKAIQDIEKQMPVKIKFTKSTIEKH